MCNGIFHETRLPLVMLGSKELSRPSMFVVTTYLPFVLREVDPTTGTVRRFWGHLHCNIVGSFASMVKEGSVLRELHTWNCMTSLIFTTVVRGGPFDSVVLTQSAGSKQLYGESSSRTPSPSCCTKHCFFLHSFFLCPPSQSLPPAPTSKPACPCTPFGPQATTPSEMLP